MNADSLWRQIRREKYFNIDFQSASKNHILYSTSHPIAAWSAHSCILLFCVKNNSMYYGIASHTFCNEVEDHFEPVFHYY